MRPAPIALLRSYPGVFTALLLLGCGGGHVPLPVLPAAGDSAELAARGEYIVRTASVCGHCHAAEPQNPDGPLSGGFAFRNWRLGTIRAANLTPDSATGLGLWSDAEIVRALRAGEDRDGKILAPVMPYEFLHGLSDHDALAVARYLRSLAPVNKPVQNDPNFVFKLARALFLKPIENGVETVPRGPTADYGGYLANNVSLCVDCHTPRKGLQQRPDKHSHFAGNPNPPKGFPANPSNITPDTLTGIGKWSEEDFMRALRTGVNPAGDTLHPFMPWQQYKRMTDDDLRSIFRYLRTVPGIRNYVSRERREPSE